MSAKSSAWLNEEMYRINGVHLVYRTITLGDIPHHEIRMPGIGWMPGVDERKVARGIMADHLKRRCHELGWEFVPPSKKRLAA